MSSGLNKFFHFSFGNLRKARFGLTLRKTISLDRLFSVAVYMLARNVFPKVRSRPSSAKSRLSLACMINSTPLMVTSQSSGKSTRTFSILNYLFKNFHGFIFLLSQVFESCRFIFLCAQRIPFVAIHGYLKVSL